MIQTLSSRFRRRMAALMYLVFYLPGMAPFYSFGGDIRPMTYFPASAVSGRRAVPVADRPLSTPLFRKDAGQLPRRHSFIGGPATPEASSFKAVGSDNLVNLFTGDFSYSIPVLDVGGYPVNLFYNGGITMEQEAGWVGLGWNINPGSVSRNMRGVPDDFDGTDMLVQEQNVKPNKTWGGEIGVDAELIGIKTPSLKFSLGLAFNNYLGPEMDRGLGVSLSIPITQTLVHEKSAPLDSVQGLSLSLGVDAKLSSRSGLTLAPSLNANLHSIEMRMDLGVGLSTSYNSRTGIKDLNIHSQMSAYHSVMIGKEYGHLSRNSLPELAGTTISFARPSYVPTLRMPMQYSTTAGQIEFGSGMFGVRGAATAQGYYTESKAADIMITKPLIGYMYLEKAQGRRDAVMDFNRVNDGEVTPHTPVLSAPVYDYDIFTVQGEGTGGSIRAYRSDLGFMRDNETNSKDKNISIGVDLAPPGHYGGNLNDISTPTRSGNWDDANNTLNQTLQFKGGSRTGSFENVYFRNPGEATVTNDAMINKIGRDNLVRFQLDGPSASPRLQSKLEQFSKKTNAPMSTISLAQANVDGGKPREKRTQVITMLTAEDAAKVGLETTIRNYWSDLDGSNNLQYDVISRIGDYRKKNHISEISVLEASGMRYVYGLPVYNKIQKDFTFSVRRNGDATTNLVDYDPDEPTVSSGSINGNDGIDGYCSVQTTPAYASAFLLTGLLSPDYVDRTGDGITEDDLGNAVKFDYTMSTNLHKWRTPRSNVAGNKAHFNAGLRSERRDNKATISYGEREAWYLHAIESKSMIAIFSTSPRQDAKGVVSDVNGSIVTTENANRKLDSIMLYTKSEIKSKGLAAAIPLKTVHFEYSYALCGGTPDNPSGGKLTLTDIYFTFNGQSRASKNMYVFNYGAMDHVTDNPVYAYNASDRWGTYKPIKDSTGADVNPAGLTNIDYPYTSQNKAADDVFAGAWGLKKILLPSGGQMEVQYEADDYAYVQNRRACNMFRLYGIGNSTSYSQGNFIYPPGGGSEPYYVYVQLPAPLQNANDPMKRKDELFAKYLDGLGLQLAFRLNINMPKGLEPLTVYANYDDYGVCANSGDGTMIYLKLRPVDGKSPLAKASIHFLIENLPGQAFPGYDVSGESALQAIFSMLGSMMSSIFTVFSNAEGQMRSSGKGSAIALASSFVRLATPTFFKYGGGHRVKRLLIKDNWNKMSQQYDSQYGQDYDYTTTTKVAGIATTISSGVASYEPGIGSEENPFREILQFENKLPLASAQYGAIEMPMLEALFPAPVVGYSKVTVRSIHRKGAHADSVVRSAIGKQVTEFYTARDYPCRSTYTPMYNMDYHHAPPFEFFYKETIDKRTSSQGFLVETNDMHGKIRSQAAYSERDENTPLSFTIHAYKNTGTNGLNDMVDFIHHEQGGAVVSGNMGIDMELMTDVREFVVKSTGTNIQGQLEFYSFVPFPVFAPFVYSLDSYIENSYRAVTTTKLINYHAIEDSVIVSDKGSMVTTRTIAYDAETGSPLVTRTLNEFNDPVYNTSYPAYWAYSGMGPAYQNVDMEFSGVSIVGGRITSGIPAGVLESGDELYIKSWGSGPDCPGPSPDRNKVWVYDTSKNSTPLTVLPANQYLVVLDTAGQMFTKAGVSLRIIRSGHRNLLDKYVASITSLENPITIVSGVRKLAIGAGSRAVAASAAEYREKWQIDNDVIDKRSTVMDENCNEREVIDCAGHLEKAINPYRKGLIGNFKSYRSLVFYADRVESDPAVAAPISRGGVLKQFTPYWDFDIHSNLVPDLSNGKWVWDTQVTKVNARGLDIESKNALNIYTSAQYGYHKLLPVAVTQNSRAMESSYEGFEDGSYAGDIDKETPVCPVRHIDYTGMTNARLVKTDTTDFQAHTGSYVLGIKNNDSSVLTFPVLATAIDDYLLPVNKDTALIPTNPGINVTSKVKHPNYLPLDPVSPMADDGFYMRIIPVGDTITHFPDGYYRNYLYQVVCNGYIRVDESGTYVVDYNVSRSWLYYDQEGIYDIYFSLTSMDGTSFYGPVVNDDDHHHHETICIPKGVYKISITCLGEAEYHCGATLCDAVSLPDDAFYLGMHKGSAYVPFYKTYSSEFGCLTNKPIPPSDSMYNGRFAVPSGKPMVLSAWVREDCGTPCDLSSYAQNQIRLIFDDASHTNILFHPSGPIIEGWQRYEAPFTAPATASAMKMSIKNSSSKSIYLDDIRIHPFNADMKSYVYHPRTLRLSAELDENNYATFYDYDEEGQLIRVKRETIQGVKTVNETRSSQQKTIKSVQ